jgi:alkanesulfonate monooxygenase SsuD/methylene tetrahydromethanopterin reductase-like flavin-dependent oxidoreductase (luciferase family)
MKFMYFPLPALPATLEDRRRERPVAYRTERWQKMFEEVVELARMAEDLGFEAIVPGASPRDRGGDRHSAALPHVAMNTETIKVGPISYVLPGWIHYAWRSRSARPDQGTDVVGMARGSRPM